MKSRLSRVLAAVGLLSSAVLVTSLSTVSAAPKATVASITTSFASGTYKVGDKLWLEVNFSEPVSVHGALLLLETGAADRYAFCDMPNRVTTQQIVCSYTVQPGDRSSDLDAQSKTAFLPAQEITVNNESIDLTVPTLGDAGSLSANSNLVIDGAGDDEQWQAPPKNMHGIHYALISEDYRENQSFLKFQTSTGSEYCSTVASCAEQNLQFRAVLPRCTSPSQNDCIESVTAEGNGLGVVEGKFNDVFPKKGTQDFEGSVGFKIPDGRTSTLFNFSDFPHSKENGKPIDSYLVTVSITGSNSKASPNQRSLFASVSPVSIFETNCDERYAGCLDKDGGNANYDERAGYRCIAWDGIDANADGKISADTPSSGDKSYCALRRPFPAGVRFTIQIRTSVEPSGWLHGRISDANITYTADKNAGTRIAVSGSPVRVPVFAGFASYGAMDKGLQDYYDNLCSSEPTCLSPGWVTQGPTTPKTRRMMGLEPVYYSTRAFDILEKWKTFVGDTAPVLPSYWNIRTLSAGEMSTASSCITTETGVTGIVTTNATAYFEGPPSFDSKSKTLQYEVAAPHYEKDGKTEFKGVYNLIVREDVAECLYGFSNAFAAPAPPEEFADESDPDVYVEEEPYTDEEFYAEEYPEFEEEYVDTDDGSYEMYEDVEYEEVSLEEYVEEEEDLTLTEDVSDSGDVVEEEEVFEETVVASIDASIITELQKAASANTAIELADGWFKFSATNFTFSKPTVKVNFAATPSKVLACVAGSTVRYVKSIRSQCPSGTSVAKTAYCVKGKAVDAVVGANPKCPKGAKVAKTLKCAKGDDARLVVALVPKCAKGWSKVNSYICVKGNIARRVSAVQVKCANGFALAKQIVCVKGRASTTVTAAKPACPKGYRARK